MDTGNFHCYTVSVENNRDQLGNCETGLGYETK